MTELNCVEGCGECCRHIHLVKGLKHLQNGDGICKYLVNNKCSIYNERPELCRYDKVYELVKNTLTIDEYEKISVQYCEDLQKFKLKRESSDKKTPPVKTANTIFKTRN